MIPVEGQTISQAELYAQRKGWNYRVANGQLNIEICPVCNKDNFHFFMNTANGLWDCKRCGEKGNLTSLATRLGDKTEVFSVQDWANAGQQIDPLPDADKLHQALLQDFDALTYLDDERGIDIQTINAMKLGVESYNGKKWLAIPYFNKGHLVFMKYRSLPPAEKDFRASKGRDVPLYNQDVLIKGLEELIFTEGEMDTLSLLSNGINYVVGVPGAGMQKTTWIDRVDSINPKKIYLLYDKDQAGQKAAQEMALKLGIDKCFNIVLPDFTLPDGKAGKDINEWFLCGGDVQKFEVLKQEAKPFDVAGVTGMGGALDELEAELEGKNGDLTPTFITPWEDLNKRLGGAEPGDLIGLMAEGKIGKTTMLMNWLDYYSKQGIPTLLYCQEMKPKRLARKWASYVTQTEDLNLTPDIIRQSKAMARSYPADLLLGYTYGHKPEHVFDVIRQAVRRYGVRVVGFDNLQLLSRSVSHQTAELNVLGKKFKELAMELNIVIILIIQPNRVKDNEIVAARNAAGSSSIEKDVDAMICLHRNRLAKVKQEDFTGFLDVEENFEPQMLVRVDLSRYSSGGICTLMMDGAKSTVSNFVQTPLGQATAIPVAGSVPVEA